jgi:uncharacterized protein (DUF1810 family)
MIERGSSRDDRHDLARFVAAQARDYESAISEIRSGRKRTHWMWYIFPQLAGLGVSATSMKYAIKSVGEAEAYLRHPVLGVRLTESMGAVLELQGLSASEVFGSPDDLKLRSCATLFAAISPPDSVFREVLNQYFAGAADGETLRLLDGLERQSK